MSGDLALRWDSGTLDLAIEDDDLASDLGLETAALLSLFTDRRSEADDEIPAGDGDRRGWWADQFAAIEGDRFGSRLWLLDRAARRTDVDRQAEEYDREALAWLLEDRVTDRLDIVVTAEGEVLYHTVTVRRPDGSPATFRFPHVWPA